MADSRVSVLLDFQSRLGGANQALAAMKNLAGTLLGAAAAYLSFRTAIRGANEVLQLGGQLSDLSQQTGAAVGQLVILRQAFADNGVSADNARTAINKMQRALVEAKQQGSETLLLPFRQLGLDLDELLALDPVEQFNRIGKAIKAIEDPAIRSATAMQIFGRSGAELQTVFLGGGIDEVTESLGQMPALLERNAVEFDRIADLLDRMGNRSRQFFTGFLDQTAKYIRKPLEDLDKLDLSGIGQRLGALAGIAIDAWNDGNFPAFMALSIEAGVEKGVESAKSIFEGLVGIVSGAGFWANLTNLFASFGVAIGKAFIDAMSEVTALFDATLTWMLQEVKKIAIELRIQAERLPIVLSGNARALAAFDGAAEAVRKMTDDGREFSIIWDESRRTFNETAQAGTDFLDEQLRLTREILGVNQANNVANLTAAERLNKLIQDRIDARNQEMVTTGAVAGGVLAGGGKPDVLKPDFASSIADQYGDAKAGKGDFGVSFADGAEAGFQSIFLEMGTAATRVFDAVRGIGSALAGGISTSLQGLIKGTMSWGDAMRNIGTTFLDSIIQAFAEMAAQYAVQKAAMFAIDVLFSGKSLALNLAAAAESLVGWIPAAIAASIASYGTAAVIGIAAVIGALAAFQDGGYTGDGPPNAVAGAVHRGEFVFDAESTRAIGPANLYAAQAAAKNGFRAGGHVGGGSGFGGGSSSDQPIYVNVAVVNSERQGMQWLSSREGRKILYKGLRDGQGTDGWMPS